MTIFHSIKYPVSDPPTKEQINAIPWELIKKWIHHPRFVVELRSRSLTPENTALLRKLIAESEE